MSLSPERRSKIGCSDIAAILGVSPWSTPWDVYQRVKHGAYTDSDDSVMARGRRMEALVIADVQQAVGLNGARAAEVRTLAHRDHPWFVGTPDALFGPFSRSAEHPSEEGIEAKTSHDRSAWGEPCTIEAWGDEHVGRVPAYYALQVYGYLEITGAAEWHLGCAFTDWTEGLTAARIYTFKRDPVIQAQIMARLVEWYERHIVGDEEPPIDGSDACRDALTAKFPGDAAKTRRDATDDEAALLAEYRRLSNVIDEAETAKSTIGNQIRASIADSYGLDSPTHKATLTLGAPSRRVAGLKQIEEVAPDLVPVLTERGLITASTTARRLTVAPRK